MFTLVPRIIFSLKSIIMTKIITNQILLGINGMQMIFFKSLKFLINQTRFFSLLITNSTNFSDENFLIHS